MLENIANLITSIIGAGVVVWTICAAIPGYEKEAEENDRRNNR